jgi:hypothetical protein
LIVAAYHGEQYQGESVPNQNTGKGLTDEAPWHQTNNAANSPVGIRLPTKNAKDAIVAPNPVSAGAYWQWQNGYRPSFSTNRG